MEYLPQLIGLLTSVEDANIQVGLRIAQQKPGFERIKTLLAKIASREKCYFLRENIQENPPTKDEKPYFLELPQGWVPMADVFKALPGMVTYLPWTTNTSEVYKYSLGSFSIPYFTFRHLKRQFLDRITSKDRLVRLGMKNLDNSSGILTSLGLTPKKLNHKPPHPMDEASVANRALQGFVDNFTRYFEIGAKRGDYFSTTPEEFIAKLTELYWDQDQQKRSIGFNKLYTHFCKSEQTLTTLSLTTVMTAFAEQIPLWGQEGIIHSDDYKMHGQLPLIDFLGQFPGYDPTTHSVVCGVETLKRDHQEYNIVEKVNITIVLAKKVAN